MTAYGFGMFGMFGSLADPFNFPAFCRKVRDIGVDIQGSPYRDYETQAIVDKINSLPANAQVFVFGASLGANNCPVVTYYVGSNVKRNITGIFGFQASNYGANFPIYSNVGYAHEAYNPIWPLTGGLGAHKWTLAGGNKTTKLVVTSNTDLHPGDQDQAVQNMFLADMKRLMA